MVGKGRWSKKPGVKNPKNKHKDWPKSWKVPKGAAAIIWYEDGSSASMIPKQDEYAPESPGMMAVLSMITTSDSKRTWRRQFLTKIIKDHIRKKK